MQQRVERRRSARSGLGHPRGAAEVALVGERGGVALLEADPDRHRGAVPGTVARLPKHERSLEGEPHFAGERLEEEGLDQEAGHQAAIVPNFLEPTLSFLLNIVLRVFSEGCPKLSNRFCD